jgi:hypothetical protein
MKYLWVKKRPLFQNFWGQKIACERPMRRCGRSILAQFQSRPRRGMPHAAASLGKAYLRPPTPRGSRFMPSPTVSATYHAFHKKTMGDVRLVDRKFASLGVPPRAGSPRNASTSHGEGPNDISVLSKSYCGRSLSRDRAVIFRKSLSAMQQAAGRSTPTFVQTADQRSIGRPTTDRH